MRLARRSLRACLLLLLVSVASVWPESGPDSTSKADYRGTGVVLAILPPPSALHATRPVIVIHHEPIVGLMEESMAMPFIAASTALFTGLAPGDRIAFGLQDTPGALLVVTIERLTAAP